VTPAILDAVAHVESRGRDDVVSPRGARGRYQLMPVTVAWCGGIDPLDRRAARRCASRLLHLQLRKFGTLEAALAAYVAGAGAVARWRAAGRPWPDNVDAYVQAVLAKAGAR